MINENSTRSIRQYQGANRVKVCLRDYGGCLVWWGVGTGKTRLVTDLINKPLMDKFPNEKIAVCVGTGDLFNQWTSRIKCNEDIYTWQSVYNLPAKSIKVKLLVVDEVHTILDAPKYSKIFEVFDYEWVILLTATPKENHIPLIKSKWNYPVADKITYEEALKNGWVSPKKEYNLRVDLPKQDSYKIKAIEAKIREKLAWLDPNIEDPENFEGWASYGLLEQALEKKTVGMYLNDNSKVYVSSMMSIQTIKRQYKNELYVYKTGQKKGQYRYVYDYKNLQRIADVRNTTPEYVIGFASKIRELYAQKHTLIYSNPNKLVAIKEFMDKFPDRRGFIFAMRASDCDKIAELSDKIAPYHNKLPTIVEEYQVEKVYKTKPNVFITKTRKISCKKQLEIIDERFDKKKFKYLASVRKLEAGTDKKDVSVMLRHSYTSREDAYIQQYGRVTRKEGDKMAIILNLISYHPDGRKTKEYQWITKAQGKGSHIININSINEIKWTNE